MSGRSRKNSHQSCTQITSSTLPEKNKRPTQEEYKRLVDAVVFQKEIRKIPNDDPVKPFALKLLDRVPVEAKRVFLKDHTFYHCFVFRDGTEIRCGEVAFNRFSKKGVVHRCY